MFFPQCNRITFFCPSLPARELGRRTLIYVTGTLQTLMNVLGAALQDTTAKGVATSMKISYKTIGHLMGF